MKKKCLFISITPDMERHGGSIYSNFVKDFISGSGYQISVLNLRPRSIFIRYTIIFFSVLSSFFFRKTTANVKFYKFFSYICFYKMRKNKTKFDLIAFDHVESFNKNFLTLANKSLLISHNLEHQIMETRFGSNLLMKHIFNMRQMKIFEILAFTQVDSVVSISYLDAKFINEHNKNNFVIFPYEFNSIKENFSQYLIFKNSSAFFVGGKFWEPNRDAVKLLSNSYREFIHKFKIFHIVGSGWVEKDSSLTNKKITGFLKDLNCLYRPNSISIAPIFSGGGAPIKVFESLEKKIPTITSSKVIRCIVKDGNPEEYGLFDIDKYRFENQILIKGFRNLHDDKSIFKKWVVNN